MADTMEKRRGQAVLRKTRAVCSSMGGLQGGDDEAAESGAEMVVRLGGIWVVGVGVGGLKGRGMVARAISEGPENPEIPDRCR